MRQKFMGFSEENQRRDNRRAVSDVRFAIGGEVFAVADLSMGGFLLADAAGHFGLLQEIVVTEVEVGADRVDFGARAEVIHTTPGHGGVGCHFVGLTPKQFDVLEALVMHRPLVRRHPPKKERRGLFSLFGH